MEIGSFPLKLAHHLKYDLSEFPVPDDFLGHGADMMGLALIGMVEFLYHTDGHAAFVAQRVVERAKDVLYVRVDGSALLHKVLHLFDEALENICDCFVGVHEVISEIFDQFSQEGIDVPVVF